MIPTDIQPSHYEWQIPYEKSATPHLILHFDMNKTMIASDREGQKSAHDTICAILADRISDRWDPILEAPMDYFHFVKYHLVPNPGKSWEIKLKQKEKVSEFLDFLKASGHPSYPMAKDIYDHAMRVIETQKTEIFSSFHKMIQYLHEKEIPYTLVIRTFGSEAPEIVQELNEKFGSGFIDDFRTIRQGNLQGTDGDLYELIRDSDHHLAIRDDWHWWYSHGEHWEYGKPFPIDSDDPGRISLFFDDNAKSDPVFPMKNIVAPYDVRSGDLLHPGELIEKNRVFPVEMLEALLDEDYYIRFIEKVLAPP